MPIFTTFPAGAGLGAAVTAEVVVVVAVLVFVPALLPEHAVSAASAAVARIKRMPPGYAEAGSSSLTAAALKYAAFG